MRVISQDGCYDIPYEKAVVSRLGRTVVAYPLNDLGSSDYIQLASYSTEEKAIKAMEECSWTWWKYNGFMIFQFPADEDIEV